MVMANIPRAVVALSLTLLLVLSPLCIADSILYSGETLTEGQFLSLGKYKFIMQSDCNLVLYDGGKPVWASNSRGHFVDCRVTLQSDGNLVMYNFNDAVIWASNTNREVGFYALILQKDRNVVLYGDAIWATGTHVSGSDGIVITSKASTMVASLPDNATHASNTAGIAMVVNN